MSTQFSPDGLWWWDGQQWVSAVSPDGRWRWDGGTWVLNAQRDVPIERRAVLVPSMETRPLQTAVVAYLVIASIVGAYTTATVAATTLHNLAAYTAATPAAQQVMDSFASTTLAAGVAVGIGWNVLLIIGTLRRWRWTYYVLMVFGLLTALGVVANVIGLAMNSQSETALVSFVSVMSGLAYFGLAIWMFRLWRERGTAWAMQHIVTTA